MQVYHIFFRIIRILLKVLVSLLFFLFTLVAIVHLPFVQRQITDEISDYLSSQTGAGVTFRHIRFSLFSGGVAIDGLRMVDSHLVQIFAAEKVSVTVNPYRLISGALIFNEVHIAGVRGTLVQADTGLNIQFLIDAFTPTEKQANTSPSALQLQFDRVVLEDIDFEFESETTGLFVMIRLGEFNSVHSSFATEPLAINAEHVGLHHTQVEIVRITHGFLESTAKSDGQWLLQPDFGSGVTLDIQALEMKDNSFSFHTDSVTVPAQFDPGHISLTNIELDLTDIVMGEDSLAAVLRSCSGSLPGFLLTDASFKLQMNHDKFFLSDARVVSGSGELAGQIVAPITLISKNDGSADTATIALKGTVIADSIHYFMGDKFMQYFPRQQLVTVMLEGNYQKHTATFDTLLMATAATRLEGSGIVLYGKDRELAWRDVKINADVGAEVVGIFRPFLKGAGVPDHFSVQLNSAGNLHKIYVDANIHANGGRATVAGFTSLSSDGAEVDVTFHTENFNLSTWTYQPWLGHADISAVANGFVGSKNNLQCNGSIDYIEIGGQALHDISFGSTLVGDRAVIDIAVHDSCYRSEIHSQILVAEPMVFSNRIRLDNFRFGDLLRVDSSFLLSGNSVSEIVVGDSILDVLLLGSNMVVQKRSMSHQYDSLFVHGKITPAATTVQFYTDDLNANLSANFDVRQFSSIMQRLSGNMLRFSDDAGVDNRTAQVLVNIENSSLLKLLGVEVDDFSSLMFTGEFNEQLKTVSLNSAIEGFKGYGLSFDSLHTNLTIVRDTLTASLQARDLIYKSNPLGDLRVEVLTRGDTAHSMLQLANDSITLVKIKGGIVRVDTGAFVFPDSLRVFNKDYALKTKSPVFAGNGNMVFNHFQVTRDDRVLDVHGDLNHFDVSMRNIGLTPLNFLLSADTTVINNGFVSGNVSYSKGRNLKINAWVDSLSVYNSAPLTITAAAQSDGNQLPFTFQVSNSTNTMDLNGRYFLDQQLIDAALSVQMNDSELVASLFSDVISDLQGTIRAAATITGPIKNPNVTGGIYFQDIAVTTVNPILNFYVPEDSVTIENSTLLMDYFTVYDGEAHPLTLHGFIQPDRVYGLAYDLQLKTDHYTLINHPDSSSGKVRGSLVIDSDIKLKGNNKDRFVDGRIGIKADTDLRFIAASDKIVLLNTKGIVEFIDPFSMPDSVVVQSENFYDSLIASLPELNITSNITIDENAKLRLDMDEHSGDYIQASGNANLDLAYDRTGNLQLSGNYTVKSGVYRLSFYDLVKKNFSLVQGSSINWNGSPKNGDLDLKALHVVASNSLGLIGHEIGENEKSIYKRSLDYQVGIIITGTVEKPVVSFSLDLPKDEKISYPVLANKLDRLRQPEYESELNKQVFGLLVLGGFLPENSGSDINSSLVATTALSNSVNALLASQLNRLTSQYVKGVNIDVGIQSFSDYSAPGGKTQTAMDFRVSKSMMNDRLSFEIGGDFDINQDQSGANKGTKNYRGDIAIIYDLTGQGDKQLKLFNNETYDIIYQEIRNTGISLIFIREFSSKEKKRKKNFD